MKKLYVSWSEYDSYVKELSTILKSINLKSSVVFGILRGGVILSVKLSNLLKIPHGVIQYQTRDGNDTEAKILYPEDLENYDTYIITEDIIDTGKTMDKVISVLDKYNKDIIICSMFAYDDVVNKYSDKRITTKILYRSNPVWVVFPWEENNG